MSKGFSSGNKYAKDLSYMEEKDWDRLKKFQRQQQRSRERDAKRLREMADSQD